MARVAALYRYPLKSAAAEACDALALDCFGVAGDRRWMVATATGEPVTQRELPRLTLLEARAHDGGLALEWPKGAPESLCVPRPEQDSAELEVTMWGQTCRLRVAEDEAAGWLSARLGHSVLLLYMPEEVLRPVDPRYARAGDRTALTDGFPLHLVGSGSMNDLNSRLRNPVEVERFRPNVYVGGTPAFDEDDWTSVRIGACVLRVVKPSPRCAVTTVDPRTGDRGKEPLRTLTSYRRREGGVMFGQNLVHEDRGVIRVGDPVEILSRRDAPGA